MARSYTPTLTNLRRAGSGFKLHVQNAETMKIELGSLTTSPFAAVGVSVDYNPFFTVNASAGWNDIPLPVSPRFKRGDTSVIRVNVEGWQNNRINLETIVFNRVRVTLDSLLEDTLIHPPVVGGQTTPI